MQKLFGRFGSKQPPAPVTSTTNPRSNSTRFQTEIDDREFPITSRFDNDEETNWDDAEDLGDEQDSLIKTKYDRVIYGQPIAPVVEQPPVNTTPDLEEWAEALPAATVKNSNIQEARRDKNAPVVINQPQETWDENIPSAAFTNTARPKPEQVSKVSLVNQLIGLWAVVVQQFRRILPASFRRLSDTLLITILVAAITISIWVADSLFIPKDDQLLAIEPAPVNTAASPPIVVAPVSPEQLFIETIQAQLRDITSQYPDDIILALNVAPAKLIVQLNPVWYQINDTRQNQLTERMWLQAKANHFSKLEIQDANGILIARSPVVGNQPIILQRRQP